MESAKKRLKPLLRTHTILAALPDQAQDWLLEQAVARSFAPGENILLMREPSAGLWLVEEGWVKVFQISLDGREHIIGIFSRGGWFNEVAALDGGQNPASAAALSSVRCWCFSSGLLRLMLDRHPEFAHAAIRLLSEHARAMVEKTHTLALYPVEARLARFLLSHVSDDALLPLDIPRTAMAAYLGTTPESISRSLRKLKEAGAVTLSSSTVQVTDTGALKQIAGLP